MVDQPNREHEHKRHKRSTYGWRAPVKLTRNEYLTALTHEFADARAALSGLLWHRGFAGEAESHWAAAAGLDQRYRQADWLREVRRWPPVPTQDLMAFLALEQP